MYLTVLTAGLMIVNEKPNVSRTVTLLKETRHVFLSRSHRDLMMDEPFVALLLTTETQYCMYLLMYQKMAWKENGIEWEKEGSTTLKINALWVIEK